MKSISESLHFSAGRLGRIRQSRIMNINIRGLIAGPPFLLYRVDLPVRAKAADYIFIALLDN